MFSKPMGSVNPMKDVEVAQAPEDSISKLAFSPNSNYLVASAWDSTVNTMSKEYHKFEWLQLLTINGGCNSN